MSRVVLWKKGLFYITMGVFTLVTTLILSELLLRVSGRVTVESVRTASEKDFDRIPGAFEPGQNLTETPHPKLIHHVSINSLGYRGPEITSKKNPGIVRILCLGDSGTYGHYVNDDETFAFYLQQMFIREKLPVEVINAGVPDTTIVDQLYYLKRSVSVQPDIVILTFSENDIDDLAKATPTYLSLQNNRKLKSTGFFGILYRSVRDTALFNFGVRLKAKLALIEFRNPLRKKTEPHPTETDANYEKLWEQYEDYLGQMKQFLEERRIRFVFSAFPTHHRIGNDILLGWPMSDRLNRIEQLARAMGIPTINILKPLQNSMLSKDELYLLPYDGHASKKGYFIQAKAVFEFLRDDVQRMVSGH